MQTPKATNADLLDEGFSPLQFGQTAASFPAWLDKLLQSASLWVEQKMSPPVYAAVGTGTYAEDCARKAEVAYSATELFRRRLVYYEANAASGNNKDEAMVLAELRKHAVARMQDAQYWLGEAMRALGVDEGSVYDGTAVTSGFTETGRYPLSTTPGAIPPVGPG